MENMRPVGQKPANSIASCLIGNAQERLVNAIDNPTTLFTNMGDDLQKQKNCFDKPVLSENSTVSCLGRNAKERITNAIDNPTTLFTNMGNDFQKQINCFD